MKGRLFVTGLIFFLILSCQQSKTDNLTSQLTMNFSNHMKNIDSSLILDSFKLLRKDTLFEKQGRMIDVFIYQREADRIQKQLKNAIRQELADSAEFYSYENKYIETAIDSLSKLVATADTTRPFGVVIHCLYWVRKKDRNLGDSVIYFFDNNMKLLDPDRIDSNISRSSRSL
jgi:hypothetical protein